MANDLLLTAKMLKPGTGIEFSHLSDGSIRISCTLEPGSEPGTIVTADGMLHIEKPYHVENNYYLELKVSSLAEQTPATAVTILSGLDEEREKLYIYDETQNKYIHPTSILFNTNMNGKEILVDMGTNQGVVYYRWRSATDIPNTVNVGYFPTTKWSGSPIIMAWNGSRVYASYDIGTTTAVLFAENINLDNYKYNTDGLSIRVVPVDKKAVCGYMPVVADEIGVDNRYPGFVYILGYDHHDSRSHIDILNDGTLYKSVLSSSGGMSGSVPDIGSSATDWIKVAGMAGPFATNGGSHGLTISLALRSTKQLYTVKLEDLSPVIAQLPSSGWTDICGGICQHLEPLTNPSGYDGVANVLHNHYAYGVLSGVLKSLSISTPTTAYSGQLSDNIVISTVTGQNIVNGAWTKISGFSCISSYLNNLITPKDKCYALGINNKKLFVIIGNLAIQISQENWIDCSGSIYNNLNKGAYAVTEKGEAYYITLINGVPVMERIGDTTNVSFLQIYQESMIENTAIGIGIK